MLKKQLTNEEGFERGSIKIIDANTESERQAIYCFRYQIHVAEMGRNIPNADQVKKRIKDEMDDQSYLAYAELDSKIIGSVRVTVGHAIEFPENLVNLFLLNRFQDFDSSSRNICFATKLMVDPKFRKTQVSFKLMAKAYEIARKNNIQFSFGGCNPYLIPMYEQLGYRQFTRGFQDPGYGFVVPILLLPEDVEYLSTIHSPYMRIARKMINSTAASQWLLNGVPEILLYQANKFVNEQERWNDIVQHIGEPLAVLPILRNFDQEEAKKLFKIAIPVECSSGNEFIRKGDVCNELNILISGVMAVTDRTGFAFQANIGDVVGSIGLDEQTHHHCDVLALTDCKILTISRFSFDKIRRLLPKLIIKLGNDGQHKGENK